MAPHRPFVVVAALVALVYLAGWLGFIDRSLLDARARIWSRPASGDLVVVAIDATSLRMLAQWPWPRRHHAAGIHALLAAGASRIAYDIVLSSPSTPQDDAILTAALAAAGPERIALPVFRQWRQTSDRRIEPVDTAPLGRFLRHAAPASINVEPDADGLVRRVRAMGRWAGATCRRCRRG
jgi:CHASE2 domain-containing sensor protein